MAELVIRISGDIKNYQEALNKAEQETGALSDSLSDVAQKSAIAFAALTAEIGFAVAAYKESEQVVNKLSASLQAQGIYSKNLVEAYQAQASKLQSLTGLSDEAIVAAQSSIQAYIGQTAVTEELTLAIADLSAAKGLDLQTTAELIGKGINGQTAALKKVGIEVDATATKQERLSQILEQVNQKFAGQAEAAGKGLGALNILRESFGNLQEELGKRFAPVIEKIARFLIGMFDRISQDPALVSLIAGFIAAATAATGLVVGLSTLGVAITATSAALTALGIAGTAALGPFGVAAAAIVAAAGALGFFATKQDENAPKSKAMAERVAELTEEIEQLNKAANSAYTVAPGEGLTKSLNDKKAELEALEKAYERQVMLEEKQRAASMDGQNEAQARDAARAAAAAREKENLLLASRKAGNEALKIESERGSQELVALKRQEAELLKQLSEEQNAANKEAYQAKLDDNRVLQEQYNAEEQLQKQAQYDRLLAQNAEYEALSDEQKEAFRIKNDAAIQDQLMTENQARQLAAQEKLDMQVKEHNTFLLNQQKFGTAYATIHQVMNSAIVKGSGQAFGELAQMQTSSNSTLKGIGKAAATAQIIIKTAESAMAIYAGFSTIPIIGPILGTAGAAAAVAFGAEQIGKVNSAAEGGLIEGGIPGVDSVASLLMGGEMVVPRRSFDEVVDAVADQRAADRVGGVAPEQAGGGVAEIVLTLKDDLMDFIEAQLTERSSLGISLRGSNG